MQLEEAGTAISGTVPGCGVGGLASPLDGVGASSKALRRAPEKVGSVGTRYCWFDWKVGRFGDRAGAGAALPVSCNSGMVAILG